MMALLAPLNVPLNSAAWDVQTADINGDGKLDLLTANPSTGTVSVSLGKGDGTFSVPKYFAAGANAREMAVGDFNGDGKLDVAVVNASSAVEILLGNGDGTLQAPKTVKLNSSTTAYSITTADMSGDGKLDLVVGGLGSVYTTKIGVVKISHQDAMFYVLLGNGDGTFHVNSPVSIRGDAADAYTRTTPGVSPVTLVVGDINGDHKSDVVAAIYQNYASVYTSGGNRPVYTLIGDGKGGLTQSGGIIDFSAWENISLSLNDWNGDGRSDLAVAATDAAGDGLLEIALGSSDAADDGDYPAHVEQAGAVPLRRHHGAAAAARSGVAQRGLRTAGPGDDCGNLSSPGNVRVRGGQSTGSFSLFRGGISHVRRGLQPGA
jgi:hypothetical protein